MRGRMKSLGWMLLCLSFAAEIVAARAEETPTGTNDSASVEKGDPGAKPGTKEDKEAERKRKEKEEQERKEREKRENTARKVVEGKGSPEEIEGVRKLLGPEGLDALSGVSEAVRDQLDDRPADLESSKQKAVQALSARGMSPEAAADIVERFSQRTTAAQIEARKDPVPGHPVKGANGKKDPLEGITSRREDLAGGPKPGMQRQPTTQRLSPEERARMDEESIQKARETSRQGNTEKGSRAGRAQTPVPTPAAPVGPKPEGVLGIGPIGSRTPAGPAGTSGGNPSSRGQRDPLAEKGYSVQPDGSIVHKDGTKINPQLLKAAGLQFSGGRLADSHGDLPDSWIGTTLEGLRTVAAIQGLDRAKVGAEMLGAGVPQKYAGRPLVNPDGTATDHGLLLYQQLKESPGQKGFSQAYKDWATGERLSDVLGDYDAVIKAGLLEPYAIGKSLGSAGETVNRGPNPQGTPVQPGMAPVEAFASAMADGIRSQLARTPVEQRRQELAALSKELQALREVKYDREQPLLPGEARAKIPPDTQLKMHHALSEMERLGVLKHLDPGQQKAVVKAIVDASPMGGPAWALEMRGLLNKAGVTTIGIMDETVNPGHPMAAGLQQQVYNRANDTSHALHVLGIMKNISALAGVDRVLTSYDGIGARTNADLALLIRKASDDGAKVINMSMTIGPPDPVVSQAIEDVYKKNGTLVVKSAGNGQESSPVPLGVSAPGEAAPLVVGAVDPQGKIAPFSQHGRTTLPGGQVITPTILMAPGTHIQSSVMDPSGSPGYGEKTGTSMAAPHVAAATALLLDAVNRTYPGTDPVTASRWVRDALEVTGKPLAPGQLPKNAVPGQRFLAIDPPAAYRWLMQSW